jgi:hypothetical protein
MRITTCFSGRQSASWGWLLFLAAKGKAGEEAKGRLRKETGNNTVSYLSIYLSFFSLGQGKEKAKAETAEKKRRRGPGRDGSRKGKNPRGNEREPQIGRGALDEKQEKHVMGLKHVVKPIGYV